MTTHTNADPAELAKFSELAHRWWDPESEFRPLHQINPLRLGWIDSLAGIAGKRVLDVGCGGGILADAMARKGADVLGIDLATKALRVAQLHAQGRPVLVGTDSVADSRQLSQRLQQAGIAHQVLDALQQGQGGHGVLFFEDGVD